MRKWLKDLRENRGLTQNELASIIGISQQYYNLIENGKRCEPNKNDTEKKIANILNFDWTKFFNENN